MDAVLRECHTRRFLNNGLLCSQVGIGIFTKSTAEYAKRGENFSQVCSSRLRAPFFLAVFAILVCLEGWICAYASAFSSSK